MNWLCFFGVHKWTKWESIRMRTVYSRGSKEIEHDGQERYCTKCGLKQMKKV